MPRGIPGKPVIICAGCGESKEHKAFGLCDVCYWQQWREGSAARIAYEVQYRQEYREKITIYQQKYREEHPEEKRLNQHRWRQENPEKVAAAAQRWREKHPEKVRQNKRISQARRRARLQGLPNTLTSKEAEHLLEIGRATYPGEKLHLDHIVPLSKGGGTTLANMHAIPIALNLLKRGELPREVYKQLTL